MVVQIQKSCFSLCFFIPFDCGRCFNITCVISLHFPLIPCLHDITQRFWPLVNNQCQPAPLENQLKQQQKSRQKIGKLSRHHRYYIRLFTATTKSRCRLENVIRLVLLVPLEFFLSLSFRVYLCVSLFLALHTHMCMK